MISILLILVCPQFHRSLRDDHQPKHHQERNVRRMIVENGRTTMKERERRRDRKEEEEMMMELFSWKDSHVVCNCVLCSHSRSTRWWLSWWSSEWWYFHEMQIQVAGKSELVAGLLLMIVVIPSHYLNSPGKLAIKKSHSKIQFLDLSWFIIEFLDSTTSPGSWIHSFIPCAAYHQRSAE